MAVMSLMVWGDQIIELNSRRYGNSLKRNKLFCSTDVRKYFLAAGIACLMML